MDDLISRQAAIDALIRKMRPHDNGDGTTTICVMSEGLVREVITDLPTAEKKGKWIVHKSSDEYHCGMVECPFCREELIAEPNEYCFCPNCGARMEN